MNTKELFISAALVIGSTKAQTILHYQVNDTDAATVAGGTIPGVDGSPNGQVLSGTVTLSEDIPTEGVPAVLGNRSMVFNGTGRVNLPGTQQLLNSTLEANGGFTYEAWFAYSGGGVVNSIIDYAGTEKLVRESGGAGAAYRNNSAAPLYPLGPADPVDPPQWHYTAIVFKATSTVDATNGITGDLTFYYDSNEPTETITGVRISEFGDSLNRTISVGAHPLGFGNDFYNGLIYEPRVSLGALEPSELLYAGQVEVVTPAITALELTELSNSITWTSTVGANYRIEYSSDLEFWNEAGTTQATEESTTFTHVFEPEFQELAGAPELFYRIMVLD